MRVVTTGLHGQVVRSLPDRALARRFYVIPRSGGEVDLAGPFGATVVAIEAARAEIVLSAAPYTRAR